MGLDMKFLRSKLLRQKRVGADKIRDLEDDDHTAIATTSAMADHNHPYFSWNEIQILTKDFSHVIGYGGFSTVYLAHDFKQFSSTMAAVKIHCRATQFLNQAFKQELDIVSTLRHQSIVKLLGYSCDDPGEGALILEYIPNGTLQEKLHASNTSILPWKKRLSIASQLAQAIDYLHSLQIIHGDIKASNILLDQKLNCKLCDFGSATKINKTSGLMCRSKKTVVGSPGYTDPLYLRTGVASKKNDIYSFGVIVLELITGIEALCCENGERLTTKAEAMLRDADKVMEMVDTRLGGEVDLGEARAMAQLSAMCLSDSPGDRPSASHILNLIGFRNRISNLLPFKF